MARLITCQCIEAKTEKNTSSIASNVLKIEDGFFKSNLTWHAMAVAGRPRSMARATSKTCCLMRVVRSMVKLHGEANTEKKILNVTANVLKIESDFFKSNLSGLNRI